MAMAGSILRTANKLTTVLRAGLAQQQRGLHVSCNLKVAKVGNPAPPFEGIAVQNNDFKEIKLQNYMGKYLVLFFYPMNFTFVCPTEITAFSDRILEFRAIDTEVVGVSVDSQYSHLAWTQQPRKDGGLGKINFPLLADLTKKISADYGVLLEDKGISLRGLFIIDRDGVVRQITINDLPVGRSVEETLRLIRAFQFVEKHGEVCPANWDPHSKPATIKPDPKESKEYFDKHAK